MFKTILKSFAFIATCMIIGKVMSIGLNLMSQPDDISLFAGVSLVFASFCSFVILLTFSTGKL